MVEEEAEALREVFRNYSAGGWTLSDVARWLNDRGFRTRNKVDRGRGSGPQLFTTWSIRDIFRNETYIGRVSWNRGDESFEGLHEAIVDPSIFDSVRVTRLRHATKPKTFSRGLRPYLLKGLLRCASCGEAYWAEQGGRAGRSYYRGARRGQDCKCRGKMFTTDALDARVGLLVYSLVLPDDWLDRAKAKILAQAPSLKARRASLEERRRRIGRAWIDAAVGEGEYLQEMAAVAEELAASDSDATREGPDAVQLLDNLEALWREANLAERARILSALLEAVYVNHEGRIVGIAPRPAMSTIFAALVTRPEAGVTLSPADGRYWWRRGRIHLPQLQTRELIVPHALQTHWAAFAVGWAA